MSNEELIEEIPNISSNTSYAVITGSSRGLGKSFAEELAGEGRNLILVSLPGDNLENFSKELQRIFSVKVLFFETDLTENGNVLDLIKFLKDFKIDILINNAGVGGTTTFTDASMEEIREILLLNMNSLVLLTHQLLPNLKAREQAYILNISSLAAFSPIPFKTVYSASKSFVYFFSRGLNSELINTNVHVAVANPGGMATNDHVNGESSLNPFLRLSILDPEQVARICLNKLYKKEKVIIPGRMNRVGNLLQKIVPEKIQMAIVKRKFAKDLKNRS